MDNGADWNSVVARLRGKDTITVSQCQIGDAVTGDDLEVIRLLNVTPPPPAIMQFFMSSNGVKLLWSGSLDRQPVQGSVNIGSLVNVALRAPAQEKGEPLEDVLWNQEFPPRILKDLKRMSIFEHIAGRSAFLTYLAEDVDARLFLVEDDRIQPILPDFATTIRLLKLYAGADNLREHLTHSNWEDRIRDDEILRRLSSL
jgi:hypothetical protein